MKNASLYNPSDKLGGVCKKIVTADVTADVAANASADVADDVSDNEASAAKKTAARAKSCRALSQGTPETRPGLGRPVPAARPQELPKVARKSRAIASVSRELEVAPAGVGAAHAEVPAGDEAPVHIAPGVAGASEHREGDTMTTVPAYETTEPLREKRFTIRHERTTGKPGQVVEGEFLWQRPTLRDLVRIEAEKARLTEDTQLPREHRVLAEILAHLKVVLKETPPWWDWHELDDMALVLKVNKEVEVFERAWFREPEPRPSGEGDRRATQSLAPSPCCAGRWLQL